MRALTSMMFGAGIVLFMERALARENSVRAADLLTRRMLWLMLRYQLYFVVLGIWILNLAWSPIWLRYFRFGPLEWCWRSLTYWQRQPMRRRARASADAYALG